MTKPVTKDVKIIGAWDGEHPVTFRVGKRAGIFVVEELVRLSDYDALAAENAELRTALAATDKLASEAAQRDEDMGRRVRELEQVVAKAAMHVRPTCFDLYAEIHFALSNKP